MSEVKLNVWSFHRLHTAGQQKDKKVCKIYVVSQIPSYDGYVVWVLWSRPVAREQNTTELDKTSLRQVLVFVHVRQNWWARMDLLTDWSLSLTKSS